MTIPSRSGGHQLDACLSRVSLTHTQRGREEARSESVAQLEWCCITIHTGHGGQAAEPRAEQRVSPAGPDGQKLQLNRWPGLVTDSVSCRGTVGQAAELRAEQRVGPAGSDGQKLQLHRWSGLVRDDRQWSLPRRWLTDAGGPETGARGRGRRARGYCGLWRHWPGSVAAGRRGTAGSTDNAASLVMILLYMIAVRAPDNHKRATVNPPLLSVCWRFRPTAKAILRW